jgi:hypothetical protein
MKEHHSHGLYPSTGRPRPLSVELELSTLVSAELDPKPVRRRPSLEHRFERRARDIEADEVFRLCAAKAPQGAQVVYGFEKVGLSGSVIAMNDVEMRPRFELQCSEVPKALRA